MDKSKVYEIAFNIIKDSFGWADEYKDGEHSIFIKVKKGERVILSDGIFVEAGLTPEESKRRLDDKIDDMLYSKPIALVKKISRRLKK